MQDVIVFLLSRVDLVRVLFTYGQLVMVEGMEIHVLLTAMLVAFTPLLSALLTSMELLQATTRNAALN